MAGKEAGVRSGPAANKEWKWPLECIEKGDIKAGVQALANVRKAWLHQPDMLIRAARHYEGAEQILIRKAVSSVKAFINLKPWGPIEKDLRYVTECPARVDVSDDNGVAMQRTECTCLDHLRNYFQPYAAGALLIACIVLSELVELNSEQSLQKQLLDRFNAGFELQTWSRLPRGSGLGTSSILADAYYWWRLRLVEIKWEVWLGGSKLEDLRKDFRSELQSRIWLRLIDFMAILEII
ncbi:unnamed protein product [Clavelina lepadiformis]|uniref:Uncharacterized protein n=1 Tax=Clavelina lepadiformis TaxID=159417 RepID=A0ABP0F2V9_CLALP